VPRSRGLQNAHHGRRLKAELQARTQDCLLHSLARSVHGCNVSSLRADVAQLVEQRFRKPQVTGSNPFVGFYITSPQESRADASRQTRLELSPSTTTITSLPGRVPLAIKHLHAA